VTHRVVCTALALVLAAVSPFALAQTDLERLEQEEAARRQAFSDAMGAIVEDLNRGSFAALATAIDREAMLERIFGLRLIDPRVKRDFREQMQEPERFEGFIASQYQAEAKDGLRAKLLLVESRGTRGRAVVRFDMPFFQANYVDYALALDEDGRFRVEDWTDYWWGHEFTQHVGLSLVQAQPNVNAARKLVEDRAISETQVFQVIEVLKATRVGDIARYFEIYEMLGPELEDERVVLKLGLDTARKSRDRRAQRRILEAIDAHQPEDPLFSLALLDYYFPTRQYDKAWDALVRVRDALGVDDGLTSARMSAARLVMGDVEDANQLADEATDKEPGLELGWWSALRARVAAGDYDGGVEAVAKLSGDFGHELGPEALGKDAAMRGFIASAPYRAWLEAQGSD
jgi:hypothetical protein